MIAERRRFGIWLLLSLAWMLLIFYKSGQSYGEQDLRPLLRQWIEEPTLLLVLPNIEFLYDGGLVSYQDPYSMLEFFIRKAAHVTEYFILAFLLWRTFAATTVRQVSALILTALLSILYAASDEWHQSFVPGRTGHAIDVYVDSIGVFLVVLLALFFRSGRSKRQKTLSR
ncbi:VanZ family protein [Tumebacillus sp. BK434]|uniref:VanZ family protein n=1 Tax=Tumebacillus sp. BK434 TaxID=2512169 RepID=UPI001049199F|nr:VanZ family protein [Tumebacillus sp. BK434]TCP53732.1 VanZ family protein [Tumebacillus sp. BK434]